METSYKKDFQRWKAEREAEGSVFYNCLSEVIDTDNDLAVGDMVMFTNDYDVVFGPAKCWLLTSPRVPADACILTATLIGVPNAPIN